MDVKYGSPSRDEARLLWEILKEDWRCQDTLLERVVVLTYRLRNWGMTRNPRAFWRVVGFLLRPQDLLLRCVYSGQFSSGATVGRRLRLKHAWGAMISPYAVIGDDCIIYHHVTLGNNETRGVERAPQVGNRVSIGAGAKLIGGVSVGNDAVVGAASLVVADVPENCVVMGVPARVVFKRPVKKPRPAAPEPPQAQRTIVAAQE